VAEAVVPVVADAARGGQAIVRLLHVAPMPDNQVDAEGRVIAYADQELDRVLAEALDYLHAVEVQFMGTPVECKVRFGDPVSEILRDADEFGADLIAVCATGRGGLSRALFGSHAEQVMRKAGTAVMVIKPGRAR